MPENTIHTESETNTEMCLETDKSLATESFNEIPKATSHETKQQRRSTIKNHFRRS